MTDPHDPHTTPDPQWAPPPGPGPAAAPVRKQKKWPWILLAVLVVCVAATVAVIAFVGHTVEKVQADAATPVTIEYRVTSDAHTATTVTDSDYSNGTIGQRTRDNVVLPFTDKVVITGLGKNVSLLAQAGDTATTITCTILADGKPVATKTSTGPNSAVACSYIPGIGATGATASLPSALAAPAPTTAAPVVASAPPTTAAAVETTTADTPTTDADAESAAHPRIGSFCPHADFNRTLTDPDGNAIRCVSVPGSYAWELDTGQPPAVLGQVCASPEAVSDDLVCDQIPGTNGVVWQKQHSAPATFPGETVGQRCTTPGQVGTDQITDGPIVCSFSSPGYYTWAMSSPIVGVHTLGAPCDSTTDNVSQTSAGKAILCINGTWTSGP